MVFGILVAKWLCFNSSARDKKRIFNSDLKSVPSYASETCYVSMDYTNWLPVFINRYLRYLICSWWPHNWISNHRRCYQKQIATEIRWIGHSLRRSGNNIYMQTLSWKPSGYRISDRPRLMSAQLQQINQRNWQPCCLPQDEDHSHRCSQGGYNWLQ